MTTMTPNDGPSVQEVMSGIAQVVYPGGMPPFDENMTCSFQVKGQWFTLQIPLLRKVQELCKNSYLDHTLNVNILGGALFYCYDFTKVGSVIYIAN